MCLFAFIIQAALLARDYLRHYHFLGRMLGKVCIFYFLLIHLFFLAFLCSFIYSFTHWFIDSLIYSFIHSMIH